MKILFVCTGNTCRSPMCEAYFNFLCRRDRIQQSAAGVGTGKEEEEESRLLLKAESAGGGRREGVSSRAFGAVGLLRERD